MSKEPDRRFVHNILENEYYRLATFYVLDEKVEAIDVYVKRRSDRKYQYVVVEAGQPLGSEHMFDTGVVPDITEAMRLVQLKYIT